jgi:hypothetical protein
MSAETFSKIAGGIQSIAVVIGLIVGGWWALMTFVFQNPAFYEQGIEATGYEPEFLKVALSLEALNLAKRQYEVTLTVTNLSKTHRQAVMAQEVEVLYFQPNDGTAKRAMFSSLSSPQSSIQVPVSDTQQIRFFAEFPKDGVYVVEANPCKKFGHSCVTQKYISVQGANTRVQRTP